MCTYLYIFVHKCNVLCLHKFEMNLQIFAHICSHLYIFVHICTYLNIFVQICTYLCRVKLMFSPSLQLLGKKSIMCWGNDRTTFAVKETTLGPTNAIIQWRKDLSARINLNLASAYLGAIFLAKYLRNKVTFKAMILRY